MRGFHLLILVAIVVAVWYFFFRGR